MINQNKPNCNLCLTNIADKKNSHILPRFMGVSMLKTEGNKRKLFTIGVDTDFNYPTHVQDTPKEDYILCSDCEKRIGVWEREFATLFFHKIKQEKYKEPIEYEVLRNGVCKAYISSVSYIIFKLTLYSILFRTHISKTDCFEGVKLENEQFKLIRQILNKEIEFVDIAISLITSHDEKYTNNFYYGTSYDNQFNHIIWMNEYIVQYHFGDIPTSPIVQKELIMLNDKQPFIGVVPEICWNLLRTSFAHIAAEEIMKERKNIEG